MYKTVYPERGFTLIELLIVVSMVAILLSLAIPSFKDSFDRRRLEGAGENVLTAIRLAHSEAIKQNTDVRIQFDISGDSWCYGLDDVNVVTSTASHKCLCSNNTQQALCTIDGVQKVFKTGMDTGSPFAGVTMQSVTGTTTSEYIFDGGRGLVTTGSDRKIILESDSGDEYHIIVNAIARMKVTSTLPGYND